MKTSVVYLSMTCVSGVLAAQRGKRDTRTQREVDQTPRMEYRCGAEMMSLLACGRDRVESTCVRRLIPRTGRAVELQAHTARACTSSNLGRTCTVDFFDIGNGGNIVKLGVDIFFAFGPNCRGRGVCPSSRNGEGREGSGQRDFRLCDGLCLLCCGVRDCVSESGFLGL